jgi:hypothetical protein
MRFVLHLIPEPWRSRYEDEVAHSLATSDRKLKDSLDVIAWGVKLRMQRRPYKYAVGLALGATFILLYLILAVGVIADEGDRADMMYLGVFAIGIIGAIVSRFRPRGMARALFGMAVAQAVVAVIALITGMNGLNPVLEIVILNAFFVALFVGSAWLFRQAAGMRPPDSEFSA